MEIFPLYHSVSLSVLLFRSLLFPFFSFLLFSFPNHLLFIWIDFSKCCLGFSNFFNNVTRTHKLIDDHRHDWTILSSMFVSFLAYCVTLFVINERSMRHQSKHQYENIYKFRSTFIFFFYCFSSFYFFCSADRYRVVNHVVRDLKRASMLYGHTMRNVIIWKQ